MDLVFNNYNANTGAIGSQTGAVGNRCYNELLIIPSLNGTAGQVAGVNGLVTPYFTPGKSRGSIYMKDAVRTNNTFSLPDAAGQLLTTTLLLLS